MHNQNAVQGALAVLEQRMPELGVAPDVMSYNAAIRALGRARSPALAGRVAGLYRSMAPAGVAPDKYTFSALFNAAHHCGLADGTFLLQVIYLLLLACACCSCMHC